MVFKVVILVISFIYTLGYVRPTVITTNRSISIRFTNQKAKAIVVADRRTRRESTHDVNLEVRNGAEYDVFVRTSSNSSLGSLAGLQEMVADL